MSKYHFDQQDMSENIEQDILAWMAEENVPGVSLAVLRDGKRAWTAELGLAAANSGRPVTADTLFEAASLTKPIFAHAVLQLAEAGELDLDAPILDLVPGVDLSAERLLEVDAEERPMRFHYAHRDPRLADVTVRRILSHSAGFKNWTRADHGLRLYLDPGRRFSYAGDGFSLLQDVLSLNLGRPVDQVVENTLLDPLNMRSSALSEPALSGKTIAQPHERDGSQVERDLWPQFYAAASLHTTAADYGRFLEAVLNPGDPRPGRLSAAVTSEMLTPQVQVNDDLPWNDGWPKGEYQLAPGVYWGLGWGLQETGGRRAFWHWGDNGNFKAFTLAYPDSGDGFIMLSNGQKGGYLWRSITEALFPGPHPALDWLEANDE